MEAAVQLQWSVGHSSSCVQPHSAFLHVHSELPSDSQQNWSPLISKSAKDYPEIVLVGGVCSLS